MQFYYLTNTSELFRKMTFHKFSLFFFLLTVAFLHGCRKDNADSATAVRHSATVVLEREEANPKVINGMLHFDSFEAMEKFIQSLKTAEKDSLEVVKAYTSLGIDVNAETIPNLTDHPICLMTELAIGNGFTSARKVEETVTIMH